MQFRGVSWWLTIAALLAMVIVSASGRGQAAGEPPLVAAARDGDLATVRSLLNQRADANAAGRDGSTALLWATHHANLDMARALLGAGAKVDTANRFGITPLLQASRGGDAPLIDLLLKARASASLPHPDGRNRADRGVAGRPPRCREAAPRSGAAVNAADTLQDQTALMWAAVEGHADIVSALLAAGADPNRGARIAALKKRENADHPTGGLTALMFAARNGHDARSPRTLIQGGADVKATNGDGATAVIIAIVNDRFDLAKERARSGRDRQRRLAVTSPSTCTTPPVTCAPATDRGCGPTTDNQTTALDLIKTLLDRGADPTSRSSASSIRRRSAAARTCNASPFYRAAIASDVEVIRLMLAKGAKVEWTPTEVKKEGTAERAAAPTGAASMPTSARRPLMVTLAGGRGAPFGGGPRLQPD